MTSETLAIPEECLADVIKVIRAGLNRVDVDMGVEISLTTWCDEEEAYLREGEQDE
jgi:hypothetical protein